MEIKKKQMFIPDYLRIMTLELREISDTLKEINNKLNKLENNADNKETDAEEKDDIQYRKKGTKTKRVQYKRLEEHTGSIPDETPAV